MTSCPKPEVFREMGENRSEDSHEEQGGCLLELQDLWYNGGGREKSSAPLEWASGDTESSEKGMVSRRTRQ